MTSLIDDDSGDMSAVVSLNCEMAVSRVLEATDESWLFQTSLVTQVSEYLTFATVSTSVSIPNKLTQSDSMKRYSNRDLKG
jgi:hypothetical protein